MSRKAALFEYARGSVLKGYSAIKKKNSNIPPSWYERANFSRKRIEQEVVAVLRKTGLRNKGILHEWEKRYQKECFYYGIRALLELERKGKTKH